MVRLWTPLRQGHEWAIFLKFSPDGLGRAHAGDRYNLAVHFSIRPSHPADFETLWSIDQACFPPDQAYSRLELDHYMRRRGSFTLIAEAQTTPGIPEILGFVVAEANARRQGHIITIDVLNHVRRSGIGSSLLGSAESRLRDAGCSAVFLETAVDNDPALRFYKRHEYFVDKTIPRYYNGVLDAFRMRKDLPQMAAAGYLPSQ